MKFNRELSSYVGSLSQVGGIKKYQLIEGKSKGLEICEFNTGNGLTFEVIMDRCMDICGCSFKGQPIAYISKSALTSPYYADRSGYEWMKGFFAGLFTTCGIINAGEPSEYGGRNYGLHGDISSTPAENVSVSQKWQGQEYMMSASGQMRSTVMLFEDVVLERNISCKLGVNEISVCDRVVNEGNKQEPLMLAYHYNFGYPLVNENSGLYINSDELVPFDENSSGPLNEWDKFSGPESDVDAAYFHKFESSGHMNTGSFLLMNNDIEPDLAVELVFDSGIFNLCMQWRHFVKGQYCLAMQPTNSYLKGVAEEQKNGTLKYIDPGQVVEHQMIIKFLDSKKAIEAAREKYRKTK